MYSRKFLRSIGAFTGLAPFREGTITETVDDIFVMVKWDDTSEPKMVNKNNLVAKDKRHLEAP